MPPISSAPSKESYPHPELAQPVFPKHVSHERHEGHLQGDIPPSQARRREQRAFGVPPGIRLRGGKDPYTDRAGWCSKAPPTDSGRRNDSPYRNTLPMIPYGWRPSRAKTATLSEGLSCRGPAAFAPSPLSDRSLGNWVAKSAFNEFRAYDENLTSPGSEDIRRLLGGTALSHSWLTKWCSGSTG